MQKRQLVTLSIISSTLLLFTACGGGSSSSSETPSTVTNTETNTTNNSDNQNTSEINTTSDSDNQNTSEINTTSDSDNQNTSEINTDVSTPTVTVPTKINITIPEGLKSRRKDEVQIVSLKASLQKTTDSIESYGYEQLSSTIEEAESAIRNVRETMIYLNSMMPDIQIACAGTAINTQCTIPAGEISLNIDSSIQESLKEIEKEFGDVSEELEIPPLSRLAMGQILYTNFDNTHSYQQDLVLDSQPAFSSSDFIVTKQLETIRWSDDNNNVETISDIDDELGTLYMHLSYTKKEDGSSFMSLNDDFTDVANENYPASKGQFSMTLEDLNDTNKTVKITSSGKFSDGTFSDSFTSIGQIDIHGGYLNSTGIQDEANYAEKETFDVNGSLLQSKYCDEFFSGTCNIDDESTWDTFDEEFGINSDEFSEESFDDANFEEQAKELVITGGVFGDGICEILPPNFIETANSNFFQESIGSIFKFDNQQDGTLYDNSFIDQLNDVKIFCLNTEGNMEMLTGDNRPTLSLKSE